MTFGKVASPFSDTHPILNAGPGEYAWGHCGTFARFACMQTQASSDESAQCAHAWLHALLRIFLRVYKHIYIYI